MRFRALPSLVCVCLIFVSVSLRSAEPFDITTTQGKYRVVELANMRAPFELTADLAWAVTYLDQEFHVHSVREDRPTGKTLKLNGQWKVIGQELIAATENCWEHYSLPDLQLLRKVDLPKPGFAMSMVHGWAASNLIVDDDHTTILATLRGPYSESWSRDYRKLSIYARDRTESLLPMKVRVTEEAITLDGYDVLPVLGPDKPQFRCGPNWFSLYGVRRERTMIHRAVFVQLVESHFDQFYFPARLHWWQGVPLVLDKDTDVTSWKRLALPGRLPVVDAFTVQPDPISAGPDSENQFIAALNRATTDQVDKIIEDYRKVADVEFKLATKREAKLIPMAFLLSFRSDPYSEQIFWTEMTKAEIINRFAKPMLHREAQARIKAAVEEHEKNLQSRQESANAIASENARQAKQPPKFNGNFKTYFGYASWIALALTLTIVCAVLTVIRSRSRREEPPVVVV